MGEACASGVVCGSAGNHAQALAFAARARGVPCEVFMPADAAIAQGRGGAGARRDGVGSAGAAVDDCVAAARERAAETGMVFVHPFDDPDVVAGQGTLGLELLEDVPDLAKVIVPIGGGGLASGVAIAVKSARGRTSRSSACRPRPSRRSRRRCRRASRSTRRAALTIADGIAVKRPGELTLGADRASGSTTSSSSPRTTSPRRW